jgi:hypothetical protein
MDKTIPPLSSTLMWVKSPVVEADLRSAVERTWEVCSQDDSNPEVRLGCLLAKDWQVRRNLENKRPNIQEVKLLYRK